LIEERAPDTLAHAEAERAREFFRFPNEPQRQIIGTLDNNRRFARLGWYPLRQAVCIRRSALRLDGTKALGVATRPDRNPDGFGRPPVSRGPASPAHRRPMLLLSFSGSFLVRFDARVPWIVVVGSAAQRCAFAALAALRTAPEDLCGTSAKKGKGRVIN